MTDDREPFREARAAGLKARQERRLENATYTAAEVKVLTEAALRLGRKEAGEEIAVECDKRATATAALADFGRNQVSVGLARGYSISAEVARIVASQPSPDATSGRTDPGMDSGLPQDSQAVRSPQEDS